MKQQNEFEQAVQDGIEIELNTGRKVKMRVVELSRFVENGEIPDILTSLVHQELYGDDPKDLAERHAQYMGTLKVARWVTDNVVQPPIKGLFNSEVMEIYGLANNPAKALARFRLQQAQRVEPGDAVPEVGTDTEPAA